jgi:hypothetical protein
MDCSKPRRLFYLQQFLISNHHLICSTHCIRIMCMCFFRQVERAVSTSSARSGFVQVDQTYPLVYVLGDSVYGGEQFFVQCD